jgi:hypothetical protein
MNTIDLLILFVKHGLCGSHYTKDFKRFKAMNKTQSPVLEKW